MRKLALGTAAVALLFAASVLIYTALQARPPVAPPRASEHTEGMGGMAGSSGELAPLVKGFYKGQELRFIHTEASDAQVADMLTRMMGPKVVHAPALAQAPVDALVYVFTNGLPGEGPFGFQPDVFDSVPGDAGYSPLRAVVLVTWKETTGARELRSVEEVQAAEARGHVNFQRPGAVVNMPVLSWPGGQR